MLVFVLFYSLSFLCLLSCMEICQLSFCNDCAIVKYFVFSFQKKCVCVLVCFWAALTAHHRPGGFWANVLFTVRSDGWKYKNKALADLASGQGLLPGSCVLTWWKGQRSSLGSICEAPGCSWGSYPHDLITNQRCRHQTRSHWALLGQNYDFWVGHIQSMAILTV